MVLKTEIQYDWNELNRILKYCESTKKLRPTISTKKKLEIRVDLLNICRKCKDDDCPQECEVKQAFAHIFS